MKDIDSFAEFLGHIQSVEWCIKMVIEADVALCGTHNMNEFKRSRIQSTVIMDYFENKIDFIVTELQQNQQLAPGQNILTISIFVFKNPNSFN